MSATDGLAAPRLGTPLLLIAGVVVLVLAVCICFMLLLKRLEHAEVQIAELSQGLQAIKAKPLAMSALDGGTGASTNSSHHPAQAVTYDGNGPVFDELRARETNNRITPEEQSMEQDELLVREVSIPGLEKKHKQWLGATYQSVAEDDRAPPARDVQTVCQGRRCMVSAVLEDRTSAQQWAKRFLMASGGSYLKQSKVAVMPASNGAYVSVQLYMY